MRLARDILVMRDGQGAHLFLLDVIVVNAEAKNLNIHLAYLFRSLRVSPPTSEYFPNIAVSSSLHFTSLGPLNRPSLLLTKSTARPYTGNGLDL
jgi:hypothetical protein